MLTGGFRPLDLHKGRPALVMGAGPSILQEDRDALQDAQWAGCVVFAVNRHVRLARHGFPLADYWLGLDMGLMELSPELFTPEPEFPGPVKLFPRLLCEWLASRGYAYGGDGRGRNFFTLEARNNPYPCRTENVLGCSVSTVGAALNLAWVMGCRPLTVIGLDLQRDAEGRLHWDDVPHPELANSRDVDYQGQADDLHGLVRHIIGQGVPVEVRGASWMQTTPYTPPWKRPPAGTLRSLEEVRVKP